MPDGLHMNGDVLSAGPDDAIDPAISDPLRHVRPVPPEFMDAVSIAEGTYRLPRDAEAGDTA